MLLEGPSMVLPRLTVTLMASKVGDDGLAGRHADGIIGARSGEYPLPLGRFAVIADAGAPEGCPAVVRLDPARASR